MGRDQNKVDANLRSSDQMRRNVAALDADVDRGGR